METVSPSEMSVCSNQTAWYDGLGDSNFHILCYENLGFCILTKVLQIFSRHMPGYYLQTGHDCLFLIFT